MIGVDRPITYVIPCGRTKLSEPSPARHLYQGAMFRHTLAAAEAMASAEGARVLVLSAKHGLVELETVLAPYDATVDSADAISATELSEQAAALGIEWRDEVYALLPRKYLRLLDEALRLLDVYVQDVYEATAGIGEQRHVNVVAAAA